MINTRKSLLFKSIKKIINEKLYFLKNNDNRVFLAYLKEQSAKVQVRIDECLGRRSSKQSHSEIIRRAQRQEKIHFLFRSRHEGKTGLFRLN